MKKIITILIAIFSSVLQISATNVSGLISSNTTWTKANSPYVVVGNVLVQADVTLTIEPGTVIKFDPSKVLQINGTLVAKGTLADTILFTSNTNQTAGSWGNIYFTDGSTDGVVEDNGNYLSGSILEYCRIEYGGKIEQTVTAMLKFEESLPVLRNSSINNSIAAGVNLLVSNYVITNITYNSNKFYNCKTAIEVGGSLSGLKITNSSFLYNNLGLFSYLYTNLIVDNNIFSYNSQAIYTSSSWGIVISNNVFENNTLANQQSLDFPSIIVLFGRTMFNNNLIQNNHSDLLFFNPSRSSTFISNIFTNNNSNSSNDQTAIKLTSEYDWDTLRMENNMITNNIANNLLKVDFKRKEAKISSNIISNNYVTGELIYASDYNEYVNDTSKTIRILNNTVTQNTSASGYLMSFSNVLDVTQNSFYNNTSSYVLKNNNTPTYEPYLDVSNNYWGLNTNEELSAAIYDFFDDATLGLTIFDGIILVPNLSNPVTPPCQVVKTDMGNNNVKVSWKANPESDIKGYNVYWGNYASYTFNHMADAGLTTSYIIEGASVDDSIAVTAYDNDYIPGKKSTNWLNENMLNGHESAYSFELHFPLGLNEMSQAQDFVIYPVPANDKIYVETEKPESYTIITISDLQGKMLTTAKLSESTTEINVSDLKPGIYFLKLKSEKGTSTQKFVKL
jgi:parallel beta-helix repeat protein